MGETKQVNRFAKYTEQRAMLEEQGSMNQSGLSELKIQLCRQRFPPSNASYFTAGIAVHERKLEEKYGQTLSKEDETDVTGMHNALNQCLELDALMFRAEVEVFCNGLVHGHMMHGTLDIRNSYLKKIGDIKTTSTETMKEFEKSARKYGYFRQAFVYCAMTGIDTFIFIGVRKRAPYTVFTMDTSEYKEDMRYAGEEVKFLLKLNKMMP